MRFLIVATLLASSLHGQSADSSVYLARFDHVWATFDTAYSYIDVKKVDWNTTRAMFRPRAQRLRSQDELVDLVKEMVATLRDVHAWLVSPRRVTHPTFVSTRPANFNRFVWQAITDACGYKQLKPNLGYCLMGDVGYVSIGSWSLSQFSVADLDSAMAALRNAPRVIVDVRPNGGGDDALAFAFAGRFAAQKTTTGYVQIKNGPGRGDFARRTNREITPRGPFQFTRPVIVLSGPNVASSNESFISAMRELPHVTIMGDTTAGATGRPMRHDLGDGWGFMVPSWIEWTADGRLIEGQGIPPDVYVSWDLAIVATGRDPVLEAALTIARRRGG